MTLDFRKCKQYQNVRQILHKQVPIRLKENQTSHENSNKVPYWWWVTSPEPHDVETQKFRIGLACSGCAYGRVVPKPITRPHRLVTPTLAVCMDVS